MKKYVISSSEFTSKPKAIKQLEGWEMDDCLDGDAKVYEVKRVWRLEMKIKLVEER